MAVKVLSLGSSVAGYAPFSIRGYQDLSATFSKTRSATDPENVWYDTGLNISVPSDGTYMIGYCVSGTIVSGTIASTSAISTECNLLVSLYKVGAASRLDRSYATAASVGKSSASDYESHNTVCSDVILQASANDTFRLDMLYSGTQDGIVYGIETLNIPHGVSGTYLYYYKLF